MPWTAREADVTDSKPRPIVFGVAGGTASGKSTVANAILDAVGADKVAYLSHDAYYRDMSHLSFENRSALNYDHPDSLETSLLIEHVKSLVRWQVVEVPEYDFTRHVRKDASRRVEPAPIVLIDGILILADRTLRELMDIRVFVDTDSDVRLIRRLGRDMNERGRSLESVISQYLDTVRPMHLEFVEPSKRNADVIIPRGGLNKVARDMVVTRLVGLMDERRGEATSRPGEDVV